MNLSINNFNWGRVTKRFTMFKGTDKEYSTDVEFIRHTYETHNAIYDVDMRKSDGDKTYHINCGFAGEIHKIHKAIEKHFKI